MQHTMTWKGHPMAKDRVSWCIRTAYALPAFALAIVGIPVYVYLPKFYTDVMGVPVIPVAAMILGVRIFDAIELQKEGLRVHDPLKGS